MDIQLEGLLFTIPEETLASPGDVLDDDTAIQLNRVWRKNVRDNWAPRVKTLLAKGAPSLEALTTHYAEFAAYAIAYRFSASAPKVQPDPVMQEATLLARETIRAKFRKEKLTLTPAQLEEQVLQVLQVNPSFLVEAKRRIDARMALSMDIFERIL